MFLIARVVLVRAEAQLRTIPQAVVLPMLGGGQDVIRSNIWGSIPSHRSVVQPPAKTGAIGSLLTQSAGGRMGMRGGAV